MPQKAPSNYFYISGIAIMMLGIPTSKFLMSIAQFVLLGTWLLYGIERTAGTKPSPGLRWPVVILKELFSLLSLQRSALIFLLIIGTHAVGLLWTKDLPSGIHDLRIKLPMLLLPIIFSTMPKLSRKEIQGLLWVYLLALFGASVEGTYILFRRDIADIREISTHISHIRLALNMVIGIFISGFLFFSKTTTLKSWQRGVALLTGLWLTLFLFIMKNPSGIITLCLTAAALFYKSFFKTEKRGLRILIPIVTTTLVLVVALFFLNRTIQAYRSATKPNIASLEQTTPYGGVYTHDTIQYPGIENGHYIGIYLCEEELIKAWKKRSKLDYHGRDHKGQQLKITLIRYLNSKGLRKDGKGVESLSESDIRAIEGGVANYYYLSKLSLRGRIYQLLFGLDQFKRNQNPNGNSILQRREYWIAGWHLFRSHPLFGVGTGSAKRCFQNYYEETHSTLLPTYRKRTHNQYLSIAIAFGMVGFLLFLFALLYPPRMLRTQRLWLFTPILLIVLLSFITEDTLETQSGVTFSIFFYSFFLWATTQPKEKDSKNSTDEDKKHHH
ncbi:MAG: hypothetical protein CSA95_08875 [Bacteroidetes bacterium]|nr:MAG: hypothetical protein CSA95_08875 [Bacteroidota bacterium]PIE88106.1 MAG: hypothetical protein CSA04_03545 [Bacteroidota bacterium]